MRVLFILLALSALGVSGCYSRANLKPRAQPGAARMHVQLNVEESAFGNFFGGVNADVGPQVKNQLISDVLKKRYAQIVQQAEGADLQLVGRIYPANNKVHFDWKVSDARGVVVLADKTYVLNYQDDHERFADNVLAQLASVDLDAYARGRGVVYTPPAPDPPEAKLPTAPQTQARSPNAYAIVIGVEKYREQLPVATHAEADAKAFAEYAKKTLGVPDSQVRLLLGQRAGRSDIDSMIKEWLPRNATAPGGKVYVFFSGHGAPDPTTGQAYLVPWDADPAYIKTRGVSVSGLYKALEALPGQQAYVFLDACFSGSGTRSVIAQGTRPLVPITQPTASRIIGLTASGARETTGAARDAAHGLFTRYLLAGMGGAADQDQDKQVTLGELSDYVRVHVSKDARLDNRDQTPSLLVSEGVDANAHAIVEGLR